MWMHSDHGEKTKLRFFQILPMGFHGASGGWRCTSKLSLKGILVQEWLSQTHFDHGQFEMKILPISAPRLFARLLH